MEVKILQVILDMQPQKMTIKMQGRATTTADYGGEKAITLYYSDFPHRNNRDQFR